VLKNVTAELAASGPEAPIRPTPRREIAEKKDLEGFPYER